MRNYQLVLLLKSDLKKDQKDKLFDEVKKIMGDVKEDKVESIGEKKLAYPIKSQRSGEYVVINFATDNVTSDYNKKLLIKDEILRHLLVRTN
ncbi:MAG TPA: 30S ribosomal protein S6 [Patescibacteria group bacterium]|nr:30S ribosomal protein S6 [Patescibacteria group bacterium]